MVWNELTGNTCLIENIEERVIDPLLGVDGDAVVILIHAAVAPEEEALQRHPVLLLVGDHQLVVQPKQNQLQGDGCRLEGEPNGLFSFRTMALSMALSSER